VFNDAAPAYFALIMAAAAAAAAAGPVRHAGRTAQAFLLLMVPMLTLAILFGLGGVKAAYLLPVARRELRGALVGALPYLDVMSACVYFLFLMGPVAPDRRGERRAFLWTGGLGLLFFGGALVTQGSLSAETVADVQYPFFIMIRNIETFGVVERAEPLIVAVWVFGDFIFFAAVFRILAELFGKTVNRPAGAGRARAAAWCAAALTLAVALALPADMFELERWSELYVPAANMFFTLAVLPAVYAIGRVRGRF